MTGPYDYCTVNVTVVDRETLPAVAVKVRLLVPDFVCFFVVTVAVDGVPGAIDAGLKLTVTNFGNELAERDTFDENPPIGVIVTV